MLTFEIQIVGDTETKFGSLSTGYKQLVREDTIAFISNVINAYVEQQAKEQDITDDITITVS